jgi:hypothetical protein
MPTSAELAGVWFETKSAVLYFSVCLRSYASMSELVPAQMAEADIVVHIILVKCDVNNATSAELAGVFV